MEFDSSVSEPSSVGATIGTVIPPMVSRTIPRRPALSSSRLYSHSMVAGGFDETSYTTRLTPRTSLEMRFEMRAMSS
jgi:hypothetical protein